MVDTIGFSGQYRNIDQSNISSNYRYINGIQINWPWPRGWAKRDL
jgi:hypothetical protein